MAFSFLYEDNNGLIFGIIFGLLMNICFSDIIGIAALCNLIVALFAMEMKRFLNKESLLSIILVSFSGTAIYQLLYWGISNVLGSPITLLYLAKISGVLLLYNGVSLMIMYFFMSRLVIKHRKDKFIYKGYRTEGAHKQ